jgi:hypothetical protein
MGGTYCKTNIVFLTAKEHYVAHHLLWKIHKSKEMGFAFHCMSYDKKGRKLSPAQYEKIRKVGAEVYSGTNNPMFGLGEKHPNTKRVGPLNPNYKKDPWLNSAVIHNSKMVNLWNNRSLFRDEWERLGRPHWYSFGKHAIKTFSLDIHKYNPRHFINMVKWFKDQ